MMTPMQEVLWLCPFYRQGNQGPQKWKLAFEHGHTYFSESLPLSLSLALAPLKKILLFCVERGRQWRGRIHWLGRSNQSDEEIAACTTWVLVDGFKWKMEGRKKLPWDHSLFYPKHEEGLRGSLSLRTLPGAREGSSESPCHLSLSVIRHGDQHTLGWILPAADPENWKQLWLPAQSAG